MAEFTDEVMAIIPLKYPTLHPADGLPVCNSFFPMDEYDNASTCENCSAHIYDHLAHHRGEGIPLRPERDIN